MKKGLLVASLLAGSLLISGCAAPYPMGSLYTGVKQGVGGDSAKYSKEGTATCTSILSLVALGDCSVEAAAKAGGITDIKLIDQEAKNYLGLYGQYTTIVKGN
ncbi:MAG: TRL-like family protein [Helicobacter sp.]|uniref:Protein trl n=1 Tax=Helicobacter bilis ATCC 43879 TaxID=613026 RepID=C3XIW3_9HELI|nr:MULTISPECIES: TRL-like family protein [Helicobacter]EEO24952.2 hypothetical protein HRAG_02009 [Helicobacter bilis ATCC 43879]MDY5822391.1 TRL-like family protein [Helicobacter sp.]MDY5950251.1 TRL-like family protein [Helicobacter sp.]